MMYRPISAFALCLLAQAAGAQCLATPTQTDAHTATPNAVQAAQLTPVAHVATAGHVAHAGAPAAQNPANARPGGELIKTAAAGTRDDAPPIARDTMSARTTQDSDDHPHRSGTAMLLAALALMSGIALRRYGSRDT